LKKIFATLMIVLMLAMAVPLVAIPTASALPASVNVGVIGSLDVYHGGEFVALPGFTFTDLAPAAVNATNLAAFDTVLLNVGSPEMACDMNNLSAQAKTDLIAFVSGGNKLIISDSECSPQDYSWLPYPFTTNNPGAMGAPGTLTIVEDSTLSSNNPADASYINAALLGSDTDAIGDMNVMVTLDPNWCVAMSGTNYNKVTGPVQTYARLGSPGSLGLLLYNGFDWDWSDPYYPPGTATGPENLVKVWQQLLLQPFNPDGLPCGVAVVGITLNPPTALNFVGTTHTVTAAVTDLLGEPVPGITVDFEIISGPNAGLTSTGVTDSNGEVDWTYTGSGGVGQDVIVASFTDASGVVHLSAEVTKDWEAVPVRNFVTGGANINMVASNGQLWTFGGIVGIASDGSIRGQFQMNDHANKVAYHSTGFASLAFSGPPATRPNASSSIAIFTATFRTNRNGPPVTVTVQIQDNGEPGKGKDMIELKGDLSLTLRKIDGGNFQVHDYR